MDIVRGGDVVRAEIAEMAVRLAALESELLVLDPSSVPRLHSLCWKCAVNVKLGASEYRITEHDRTLFSVDERVAGGEWQQLTRRRSRELAEAALDSTRSYRLRRDERQLRVDSYNRRQIRTVTEDVSVERKNTADGAAFARDSRRGREPGSWRRPVDTRNIGQARATPWSGSRGNDRCLERP